MVAQRVSWPLWAQVAASNAGMALILLGGGWGVFDRILSPIEERVSSIDSRIEAAASRSEATDLALSTAIGDLKAAAAANTAASAHLQETVAKLDTTVGTLSEQVVAIQVGFRQLATDVNAGRDEARQFYEQMHWQMNEIDARSRQN